MNPTITPDQERVLGFYAQGFSDREIAEMLERTLSTVRSHSREIRKRFSLRQITAVVYRATVEEYQVSYMGKVSAVRNLPQYLQTLEPIAIPSAGDICSVSEFYEAQSRLMLLVPRDSPEEYQKLQAQIQRFLARALRDADDHAD
jgi:DNA-binding CsgD family transcriptional regulator